MQEGSHIVLLLISKRMLVSDISIKVSLMLVTDISIKGT